MRTLLTGEPLFGRLFGFRDRRGDRAKILYWDTDGSLILHRRLEKGTFRFPAPSEAEALDA
jgi:transposase